MSITEECIGPWVNTVSCKRVKSTSVGVFCALPAWALLKIMYVAEMVSGVTGLRWPQITIQRDGKALREQLTLFRKSPITRKQQSGQSLQDRQAALYCLFVVVMLQCELSFH